MARYRSRWSRPDPLPDEGEEEAQPPAPTEAPPEFPRRDDSAVLAQLQRAEIVACEQVPQGSNYSFAVGLSLAGTDIDLLGIYKPRRGEVPLWDFPGGTLYRRERAAYLAAEAIGWQFVPPTVIREGPYGTGSVQLYIQPAEGAHYFRWREQHLPALMRIAAFDYLSNNADRKAGHCLLDKEGQVWAIDHGLTFNSDPKLRTVIREFAGTPLPAWLHDDLRRFACSPAIDTALAELKALLQPDEVAAFVTRLERLLKRRVFPRLDSYDSVPRGWW